MAAPNINNVDIYLGDDDFNDSILTAMRTSYYDKLAEIFRKEYRPGCMFNMASQGFVNMVMQKLKKTNDEIDHDQMTPNLETKDFKIVFIGGKERLVKKILGAEKIIIPWEDSFEILWAIHLQHCHPDCRELKRILHSVYLVNRHAVECITNICPICVYENRPNVKFTLHFVPLSLDPVFGLNDILALQDNFTKIIRLKPITKGLAGHELTNAIITLFRTYGPPRKVLISHPSSINALADFTQLRSIFNYDIIFKRVEISSAKINLISSKIKKWMTENQREDWENYISDIENDMNGELCENDNISANVRPFANDKATTAHKTT